MSAVLMNESDVYLTKLIKRREKNSSEEARSEIHAALDALMITEFTFHFSTKPCPESAKQLRDL